MEWIYKETIQDEIFPILWERHPENLNEKEHIQN